MQKVSNKTKQRILSFCVSALPGIMNKACALSVTLNIEFAPVDSLGEVSRPTNGANLSLKQENHFHYRAVRVNKKSGFSLSKCTEKLCLANTLFSFTKMKSSTQTVAWH